MTTAHVIILGLLCDRPLHGYEIKQLVEQKMEGWADIKFGSIYFALEKLEEHGFVEVKEEAREGNRPAKTVYRVTQRGRGEFVKLLAELWEDCGRTLYPFDVALHFIGFIPLEDARRSLERRIRAVQDVLSSLGNQRRMRELNRGMPGPAVAIISHAAVHMEAEMLFLEDLLEHIEEYYR